MGHELRLAGTFLFDSNAPYGDLAVPVRVDWALDVGSTSGKANRVLLADFTLAASATRDINLGTVPGPGGEFTPDYVAAFALWSTTAGGKGTLTSHATNGWTGLGSAPSIPISTGPFVVTSDTGIAITSTDRVLVVTNTGAASASYRVAILLRDSA